MRGSGGQILRRCASFFGGPVPAYLMDRNLLPFDATIVQYLNDKIGTFHELDTALFVLSGNPLAKGMLFMARCGGSTSANPEWGTVRRLPTGTVFGPVTGRSADRAGNRALVAKPWPVSPVTAVQSRAHIESVLRRRPELFPQMELVSE